MDFADTADYRVKLKENEKKDKYLDLAREHESDVYTSCDWCSWYSHQMIIKGNGGLRNKRTSGDHSNYSIYKIGQNIAESPRYLRRLAVTQTSVKESVT